MVAAGRFIIPSGLWDEPDGNYGWQSPQPPLAHQPALR